jgi:hypothetical protein
MIAKCTDMLRMVGGLIMVLLLSTTYWIIVPVIAIPFKLMSDPLKLKHPNRTRWIPRLPRPETITSMKKRG